MAFLSTVTRLNAVSATVTRLISRLVRIFATALGFATVAAQLIRGKVMVGEADGTSTASSGKVRVRLLAQAQANGMAVCVALEDRLRDMLALANGSTGIVGMMQRLRIMGAAQAVGSASATTAQSVRKRLNNGTVAGHGSASAAMDRRSAKTWSDGTASTFSDGTAVQFST